ncbi:MAG: phosphotransferase [Clostridia bacterium]|nr:phosphotransferase [Clostridia bacterium]
MSEILSVLEGYEFFSPIDTVEKMAGGNVNASYKITSAEGDRYVLQKINTSVFPCVPALMENVEKVTEKLRKMKEEKSLDKMRVLNIKFTKEGRSFLERGGVFYRVYDFVKNSAPVSSADDTLTVYRTGKAFGIFDALMNEGELPALNVVIKDFHNTPLRIENLERSYKKAPESRKNRAKQVAEYIFSKSDEIRGIYLKTEACPNRIVHNDTKCNNVIFDRESGEALGVFDLDTVMYGRISDDFGDGVRSIAGPAREDEKDLSSVFLNMENFKAFAEGFLSETAPVVTDGERGVLAGSVFALPLELSARFLTDYLDGNTYFRVDYPEQNLDRAKCQAALARDAQKRLPEIKKWLKTR